MKEIQEVSFHNVQNAESYQFHEDVNIRFTVDIAATHKLTALRDTYVDRFQVMRAIFVPEKGYKSTKAVEEADAKRDEAFLFLKQSVEVNRLSPVAAKRTAAEELSYIFNRHRGANEAPYAQNTAIITNLAEELMKEENVAYLTELDLGAGLERLISANDSFKAIYSERKDEKRDRKSEETMKTIRPQVDAAYFACVKAINTLYYANELTTQDAEVEASLGALIDGINADIVQLKETISLRLARNENAAEKEEEEAPATATTPPTEPTA